jgi:hypothetical protein
LRPHKKVNRRRTAVWLRVWLRAACLLVFLLVSLEIHAGTVTGRMQTERLPSGCQDEARREDKR